MKHRDAFHSNGEYLTYLKHYYAGQVMNGLQSIFSNKEMATIYHDEADSKGLSLHEYIAAISILQAEKLIERIEGKASIEEDLIRFNTEIFEAYTDKAKGGTRLSVLEQSLLTQSTEFIKRIKNQ